MGLNVGATLYSGGQINNTIKQGKIDVQAAEQDAAATFNDIALSIANVYLSILMSEEQLENANQRRKLSQGQLEQTDKLISAGSLPASLADWRSHGADRETGSRRSPPAWSLAGRLA
jgi:outer membrane protein